MTIKFYCPNCSALIAFDSKHVGKRARCLTCGQIFIIPSKDDETPKKIKPEPERTDPVPGFNRALFVDTWKIFIDPRNATSLVFVIAVVCFKFFLAREVCCGRLVSPIAWGWLLGFYLNIIYESAFEIDTLPEIYLGTSITFLWNIIKPFAIFLFTMVVVQLPFIIALVLLKDKGLTPANMWDARTGFHLLLQALFIFGLFLFPIAILTAAVGQDFFMLLRPDYLIAPVFRAFVPYLIAVALLVLASVLETQTAQYDQLPFTALASRLGLNLAVQVLAIIAMRSIGLFYRHYNCYLRW
ncbi:MAG: zinc-ribbon domain-containing protein [Sedimentisphaerales bacterium]|nr:zinc-ribbon domain-containing protein [Sedimentisphaerales bacterium]